MVNLVKFGVNAIMNRTLEQIFEENNLIPKRDCIKENIDKLIKKENKMNGYFLMKKIDALELRIKEQQEQIDAIEKRLKERQPTGKRFQPPTQEQVVDYICNDLQKLCGTDALTFSEKFIAHYEANGWKVGRNAMKDWKASVRKWDIEQFNKTTNATIKNGKFDSTNAERIYKDAFNI